MKKNENWKVGLVINFANDVIEYLEGMPMLTDEEEALLSTAEFVRDRLLGKI